MTMFDEYQPLGKVAPIGRKGLWGTLASRIQEQNDGLSNSTPHDTGIPRIESGNLGPSAVFPYDPGSISLRDPNSGGSSERDSLIDELRKNAGMWPMDPERTERTS